MSVKSLQKTMGIITNIISPGCAYLSEKLNWLWARKTWREMKMKTYEFSYVYFLEIISHRSQPEAEGDCSCFNIRFGSKTLVFMVSLPPFFFFFFGLQKVGGGGRRESRRESEQPLRSAPPGLFILYSSTSFPFFKFYAFLLHTRRCSRLAHTCSK